MMRIDSHQHFWHIAQRAGAWPPPQLEDLHRDFTPEDLLPLLAMHGVSRTVLVQSLPTEDDTSFMLDIAGRHEFIGAVVGWTDLKHAQAPTRIALLAREKKLKGFRPMLQDLEDPCWVADPRLTPAVVAMVQHGLRFDALVTPRELPALHWFAKRYPDLQIVIDHGAKPAIAQRNTDTWSLDIAMFAELPNVHCKLSGLVTQAGSSWDVQQLRPYVDSLLSLFGPERLMWGSDWPVLGLVCSYSDWLAASEALLEHLLPVQRNAIFYRNAMHFYGIT